MASTDGGPAAGVPAARGAAAQERRGGGGGDARERYHPLLRHRGLHQHVFLGWRTVINCHDSLVCFSIREKVHSNSLIRPYVHPKHTYGGLE